MLRQFLLIQTGTFLFSSTVFAQESPRRELMVIAHRGASAYAPENTLAAFKKAIELKVDALEVDIRQTKDHHLVALHDGSVDRTTNGSGDVSEFTLDELKRLDVGSWFSEEFRNERIPVLQEVVDLLDSSTTLIIEVKGSSETYPQIEENIVDLVRENGIERQVILKSFDRDVLMRVRALASDIPRLYVFVVSIPFLNLTIDQGVAVGDAFDVDVQFLQPHRLLLTRSFIRKAQSRGFKVIGWDIHTEEHMREAVELGVDGIETDFPDILIELLRQRGHERSPTSE